MLLTRWITFRSLRTRPLRTLLSTFGIILGVAGLLAIQVTNLTVLESVSRLFEDTAGKSDLIVTHAGSAEQGLPERLVNRLLEAPGVEAAVPSIQVRTSLANQAEASALEISLLGPSTGGLSIYGIDPLQDEQAREYNLTQGKFLSKDLEGRELILVENFARDNDLQVGKSVSLVTPNGMEKFTLVGLIAQEGVGQNNNGAFGVIPLQAAQSLFNRSGELDQIDVRMQPEYTSKQALEAAKNDIQSRLGAEYAVTSPAARGERVGQMLQGYQIGLNFLSGMALFVGAFLIYNAFSMTVVERTREIGLLRTLGMTRGQVTWQVLAEAVLLGVTGSLVGAGLGLLMARGLARLFALMLNQPVIEIKAPVTTILTSLLVGLSVTLVAATIPAWQAGRISPLEALRVRGVRREGWLLRRGWILGMVLLVVSTAILVFNPFPYDTQYRLGSVAVVLLFFGGTLLIPASVGGWERLTRPVVVRLYGTAGRLGSGNLQRARLRTTLTVAALMVGVSMIMVTKGMTESFRSDLQVWINAYVGGDLLVSSTVPMRNSMGLRLEAVEGIQAVAPLRYFEVVWDAPDGKTPLIFMAVDPSTYSRVTSFIFSDSQQDPQPALEGLSAGKGIFISSVLAEKYGLKVGDQMRLRTHAGEQEFQVVAVVVNFFNQGLTIQGNWKDMRSYFKINDANAYMIKGLPGQSAAAIQQRIESLYGKREHITVVSNQVIIQRVMGLLNQAYSLFDALAVIAMVVAALGVVNTLTMNVIERIQEIGMLRSIGLTRGQVLLMILAEAALMGLIGALLGLVFGTLLTRIFLWGMTAMSGYKLTLVIPMQAVAFALIITLVVTQLAALFPARRAARFNILEAISYE